jgi:hypothetical protein
VGGLRRKQCEPQTSKVTLNQSAFGGTIEACDLSGSGPLSIATFLGTEGIVGIGVFDFHRRATDLWTHIDTLVADLDLRFKRRFDDIRFDLGRCFPNVLQRTDATYLGQQ